jgi:hypothetical protein
MRERDVYLDREQLMKNIERSYTPQAPTKLSRQETEVQILQHFHKTQPADT